MARAMLPKLSCEGSSNTHTMRLRKTNSKRIQMKKKTLWYVARADLSQPGTAAAIHSREDVAGLRECGWDAYLLTSAYAHKETGENAATIILTRKKNKIERLAFELKACSRLLSSAIRPDFIFFRGPTNLLLIGLVARWLKIPFGMELNGVLGYRYGEGSGARAYIDSKIDSFFMRNSAVLVGVTPELAKLAQKEARPGTVVTIAPNAVNLEEIKPVKPAPRSRDLMLGFLGMAYQSRGLEHAIVALAILNQRNIQCGLRCVGGGPKVPELRQLAQQHGVAELVEFRDCVQPSEMAKAVADCDIMWASYESWERHELTGLSPLKIWTYLALAKPVLVRDPGEVLVKYKDVSGLFWVDHGTAIAIADKLNQLLEEYSRDDLINFGLTGRVYVEQHVSWLKHCRAITAAIERWLEHNQ